MRGGGPVARSTYFGRRKGHRLRQRGARLVAELLPTLLLPIDKPIYARTSAYGHFGRSPDADGGFSWERTDLADAIKTAAAA